MEYIAAVLLLVGCAQAGDAYRELPAPMPLFEAVEDCRAELDSTIAAYSGRYPRVLATCVEIDPALEEGDAELVWDVGADGILVAGVEYSSTVATIDDGGKESLSQE